MSKRTEVRDLVLQLQQLNIRQTELIGRLNELTGGRDEETRVPIDTEPREFEIGDTVRILNPSRFQANRGVIVRIGANRITVQPPNGSKIVRAAKNLVLED